LKHTPEFAWYAATRRWDRYEVLGPAPGFDDLVRDALVVEAKVAGRLAVWRVEDRIVDDDLSGQRSSVPGRDSPTLRIPVNAILPDGARRSEQEVISTRSQQQARYDAPPVSKTRMLLWRVAEPGLLVGVVPLQPLPA
jgi:hypothetical protein